MPLPWRASTASSPIRPLWNHEQPRRLPGSFGDPAFLQMPKSNLHAHLEGSIRPATWWELAQAQGLDLGIAPEAAEAAITVDGRERGLADYLARMSRTYPVLRTGEALQRRASEAEEDTALDGII